MQVQYILVSLRLAVCCVGLHMAAAEVLADDLPPPELDKAAFVARLQSNFLYHAPEVVKSLDLTDQNEKDLILDNLAHLPALQQLEFSVVGLSERDAKKIAPFANITHLIIDDDDNVDLEPLAQIPALEEVSFSRCENVPWATFKDLRAPKLRRINVRATTIDADALRALAEIGTLEGLKFSDVPDLDDAGLRTFAKCARLRSLAVYNCSAVTGEFLADLTKLPELREFDFTGPLPAEHAQQLAAFTKLEAIGLNAKDSLSVEWYEAIAKNCTNLQRLTLWYQGLDKAQFDHVASLTELKELTLASGSQIPDSPFGTAHVPSDAGIFEGLPRLAKLEKLHLSGRYQFSAVDGGALASLEKLQQLKLWNIRFDDDVLKDLGRLKPLTELDLYGCTGLGTADAAAIGSLPNLKKLALARCTKAKSADLAGLRGLAQLQKLDLSHISNLTNSDMAMAAGLTSLEELTLRGSIAVTDKGLAQWRQAPQLKKLWLQKLSIGGSGFADWPADHPLREVFIEGSVIRQDGLQALSRLPHLASLEIRVLDLFGGETRVDLSCFLDTPKLEYLSLLGSYSATAASVEKLASERPKLNVVVATGK